jgi:hypothetical protein
VGSLVCVASGAVGLAARGIVGVGIGVAVGGRGVGDSAVPTTDCAVGWQAASSKAAKARMINTWFAIL